MSRERTTAMNPGRTAARSAASSPVTLGRPCSISPYEVGAGPVATPRAAAIGSRYTSAASTHTPKAIAAATRKPACQPRLRASAGMIAAPSIPLTLTAAWFAPMAVARSCGGNHTMTALTADG